MGSQTVVWATQARPLRKLWHPEVPGTIRNRETLVNSIIAFTGMRWPLVSIFMWPEADVNPSHVQPDRSILCTITHLLLWQFANECPEEIHCIGIDGVRSSVSQTSFGQIRRIVDWYLRRVFTASIVRVAYVNDFKDPDISWALRRVYLSTIVERNFAEVIADMPAIFQLVRSIHGRIRSMVMQGSRTTPSKSGSQGQSGILTIGSAQKRLYNAKRSSFAAYGDNGQFTTIRDGSEDEIPLKDRKQGPNISGSNIDRGITVQIEIDIESQERNNDDPVWPKGSLRPQHWSGS